MLRERSVKTGEFTLSSGQKSSFYIDARLTTMWPDGLVLVGQLALGSARDAGWTFEAAGGLTMGADPIACAIARASVDIRPLVGAFTVRKEAKGHGTGRRIEGCLAPGQRALIVEDVITSGASAISAIEAVREYGAEPVGVVALVDRTAGGAEAIRATGIPLIALTSLADLGITP